MSTQYGSASAGGATPQAAWPPPAQLSRPATLAVAVWGSVVVALLTIIGAVVMIANGKASIRSYVEDTVRDTLGSDATADVIQSTVGSELDDAYHKLVVKAVVALVIGVVIAGVALLARNGGTGGRVTLTIALVVGMCAGSGLQLGDRNVLPSISVIVAGVTPLLSLIAIICLFLPATNAYAKSRKR